MATDDLRLVLTRDVVGSADDAEVRREGAAYSPRTRLRRALADRALDGFGDVEGDPLWLVVVRAQEDDADGVVVGVSSRRSGLVLGPRKRDRLADLSADDRHLLVHFRYADQSEPVNNVFAQILGAARRRR